ncbi:fimbrial protein [Dyella lutea]|uniref:Type 1 fimbrial protein n=1 Tax=Dyella lutea TaxID=2950441 RepID=A0ABT1F6V1_9GAMM|nr:fimbrial protein [Dyella lutea]MCP1373099.1 type 1 fimbrial protein [Dyella lutea]
MKQGKPDAAGTRRRSSAGWRRIGALVLLAALSLLGLSQSARASCSFDRGSSQGNYYVSVPSSIVNDPGIAVGQVLFTSTATPISPTVYFNCRHRGNGWGLVNDVGVTPGTTTNLFPSNVPGVGYRILQSGNYIYPYPYFSLDGSSSWYESDAVTLEIVKTGTIADGSTLSMGPLVSFEAGSGGSGSIYDAVINLANSLTFTAPACQVSTPNVDVTLPTVSSGAFSGVGSVTGATPFQIRLQCSSGATVRITMTTGTPVGGQTGVIAPSSGTTTGVGVQVLSSSGNPVQFGTAAVIGATPNGTMTVNYSARYFQTAATVGPGTLGATATFTLSYQ